MRKPAIVCVDDERSVLASLRDQLRHCLGADYQIELAESGDEAFEILNELTQQGSQIPIIISDQIMPGMKGDELLIKVHSLFPETIKIMLTGQANVDDVGNAVNRARLYRYISKPWHDIDLCLTVKEALRSYDLDRELNFKNQALQELNVSLEAKVRERSAQLEERNRLLQEQNQQIEQLSLLKDQLISTVSHDLRNPIGSILGVARLLLSLENLRNDPEQVQSLVEQIHRSAERMYKLVNDLLDLSRIEQGMPLQRSAVNLGELLSQQIESFRANFQAKSLQLMFEPPPANLTLTADATGLGQVFSNLISNAIKYTPQQGSITVSTQMQANRVAIQIADTGIGIPSESLPLLFTKFFRVDNPSHRAEDGTGLGLAIVKGIVEQHQGQIEVESEVGKGSIFRVFLPFHSGDKPLEQPSSSPPCSEPERP